ncbi:extracellular solute-binding protein [Nocardioides sp. R-C-SC26]|uniref:extracellular solute-binding protein n=1 Tax=Nocardioides sp. R-C-SC26 TaxID=2870414 RepID=UPI001E65A626|nr:extracellular solute-binding protein [Nocardioides sp. R-C-SC26]
MRRSPHRRRHRAIRASRVVPAATLALAASLLAACGSEDDVLNWYVNPDGVATLTKLAEQCSTEDYRIQIQLLPSGATDQRTQLARRLAARDSSTDLMSLDPVFVPEFASAGWLQEFPEDAARAVTEGVLDGPLDTVTWEDKVYAAPQWANTQVLWYRKSLAEAAGLSMSDQVTWGEVIDAAAKAGGTVGVQANKYEAYMVWINAMVLGAGGDIVSDTEAGKDAQVDIDSDAGRAAAGIIEQLAESSAAQPDLSVSNEGTSLGQMFPAEGPGEFMVNWTFVYKNYLGLVDDGSLTQDEFDDLGWVRYPRTVAGEASRPPVGGIDIGVGAYSQHPEWALEAAQCVTTSQAQEALARDEGLMPARAEVYSSPELSEYPDDLLKLWQDSLQDGGPRPKSAYYALISAAVQARWHSPTSVDQDTPAKSARFLRDVLDGKALL